MLFGYLNNPKNELNSMQHLINATPKLIISLYRSAPNF